jgi:hypothetical protein
MASSSRPLPAALGHALSNRIGHVGVSLSIGVTPLLLQSPPRPPKEVPTISPRCSCTTGTIGCGTRAAKARIKVVHPALSKCLSPTVHRLQLVGSIQACPGRNPEDTLATFRQYWNAGARTFILRVASLDNPTQPLPPSSSKCSPEMNRRSTR